MIKIVDYNGEVKRDLTISHCFGLPINPLKFSLLNVYISLKQTPKEIDNKVCC